MRVPVDNFALPDIGSISSISPQCPSIHYMLTSPEVNNNGTMAYSYESDLFASAERLYEEIVDELTLTNEFPSSRSTSSVFSDDDLWSSDNPCSPEPFPTEDLLNAPILPINNSVSMLCEDLLLTPSPDSYEDIHSGNFDYTNCFSTTLSTEDSQTTETRARDHGTAAGIRHNVPLTKSSRKGKKHKKIRQKPNRCIHLWQFLRDLLDNKDHWANVICWTCREKQEFRLIDTKAVAELWGMRKNRGCMTYEKMARTMRYYYKLKILERVPKKRLHFRFGKARLWTKL